MTRIKTDYDHVEFTRYKLDLAYKRAMRGGTVNDHDYIADCRPVDLKSAVDIIDQQHAEIERLKAKLACL